MRVVLEDGTEYPQAGKLLFSDLSVDPATGQVTLRAEVPNAKGALLPGLYVRVRLQQAKVEQAVLLPLGDLAGVAPAGLMPIQQPITQERSDVIQ